MNADEFVRGILYGEDTSPGAHLARFALTPLAWTYQVGLEAYLAAEKFGLRKRYRLPVPVISIGNISSGGTGKTPTAIFLASGLRDRGRRVVVLSRGHGGTNESRHEARIVSDGTQTLLTPDEAGDEPVLLADHLPGVPVIVCRDRRVSGRLAVERFAPDVIVLDDALQYWQLHRDLDIVLLDARRPFDNGYVLPRGLLREPPSHLARTGIVILTRADQGSLKEMDDAREYIRNLSHPPTVFTAVHAPDGWITPPTNHLMTRDTLADVPAFVFSGIADGKAFAEAVREERVAVRHYRDFGDHHHYSASDIEALIAGTRALGDGAVAITTEKDLVKVSLLWSNDAPPLFALRVALRVNDAAGFWEQVRFRI